MHNKKTLKLFQAAASEVPAYQEFIKNSDIDASDILNVSDLTRVPVTSKENYLKQFAYDDLFWKGSINKPLLLCATSGSTGEPFYFARNDKLSLQYSYIIEDFLRVRDAPDRNPTLVIDAFGMGVWIGGVITMRAFEIASRRMNYPLSILPVGYNKVEVIKALRLLAPKYKQVILIGYPPFVKEIVDECGDEKIDLKKLNVRLFFAAESFTESFRDYLCKQTNADPILDTMNIYGTADIGAMAYETPMSIFIRR